MITPPIQLPLNTPPSSPVGRVFMWSAFGSPFLFHFSRIASALNSASATMNSRNRTAVQVVSFTASTRCRSAAWPAVPPVHIDPAPAHGAPRADRQRSGIGRKPDIFPYPLHVLNVLKQDLCCHFIDSSRDYSMMGEGHSLKCRWFLTKHKAERLARSRACQFICVLHTATKRRIDNDKYTSKSAI